MSYRPIDYAAVRQLVPISRILEWLQYEPTLRRECWTRGACLLVDCGSSDLSLRIDLDRSLWNCFACHRGGDQLELWRLIRGRSLYPSTLELCRLAGHPVPYREPIPQKPPRPATT